MGLHTGDPCFACGKKIMEDDDVVVCPECGTPYHRSCWEKNGKCINIRLHRDGKTWERPSEPKPEEGTPVQKQICPRCGAENNADAKFCPSCGMTLQDTPQSFWQTPPEDPNTSQNTSQQRESVSERFRRTAAEINALQDSYCGMDPESKLEEERLGDVADFVQRNTIYYLPKFQQFQKTGRRISLNFPAFLFPQYFFAYRKMWGVALILVAIFALLSIPQELWALQTSLPDFIALWGKGDYAVLAQMYPQMQQQLQHLSDRLDQYENIIYNASMICNYFELCLKIFLGIFGNFFYFRFVLRRVRQIKSENLPEIMYRDRLRTRGGTNGWLILAIFAAEYVLTALLLTVLFLILFLS